MELTKGQEEGLKIAVQRYRNHKKYTCIAGFSGSGKSTLIKYIIEALDVQKQDVIFTAYTGKATSVLVNKGCTNACTLHKLMYNVKTKKDGSAEFIPKECLDYPYKLIVIDEVSMVPDEMWELLLTYRVHVLALGDPFQLPPVQGESRVLNRPHVFLNEIVRQALDSPIIRMSMDVRNGVGLKYGGDKYARVIRKERVSEKLLLGADIIICGRNSTRRSLNNEMRHSIWGNTYKDTPLNGDKLICLKNNWRTFSSTGDCLINGMIGEVNDIHVKDNKFLHPMMLASFASEMNGRFTNLNIDYKLLTEGETTINGDNWMKVPKRIRPLEFDYGYAITAHKSEGSEWEKVLVFLEPVGNTTEMRNRWVYTALTRSSSRLVVVA